MQQKVVVQSGAGALVGGAQQLGETKRARRSQWTKTLVAFRKDPAAVIALGVLAMIVVVTVFAPVLAPYDPDVVPPGSTRMAPPFSAGHLLGTDGQGRDLLSRMLYGGLVSLPSALIPVVIATSAGLVLGMVAGYRRGLLGELIMRGCDIMFAFPSVILAIGIASIAGRGQQNVMIAVSIVFIPSITRLTYGVTRDIASREFIHACKLLGATDDRVILRHILPNVFPPVLVYASTITGVLVVFSAGLSFLGLGIQPPTADWGMMVSDGRAVLSVAPHVATLPGLMISLTALSFNLVGDGLRFALDPRTRNIG